MRALYEDSDGVMWIGTYDGGLYRLEDERLTRYTTNEGLHDNGVFQILEDAEGYFWMGSNRGISRVKRQALNDVASGSARFVRSTMFGIADGLSTLECNGGRQPSGLTLDDGTLWFPTQGGVAIVDSQAVRTNSQTLPALVEEFHLQGNPVEFRDGVEVLPDQNSFEIRYTAMSFVRPEQVICRHRLVGLDDGWVDASDRRAATYYRIPPGEYRFVVSAANSDGAWSDEGEGIAIVILAPVWRRGWFMALTALALAALLVVIDRRRNDRLRREHARQRAYAAELVETQENERRRISNELHDSLGQDLFIIKAHARQSKDAGDGSANEALDAISKLAGKAYDDMKEIAYDLRPYPLDKIGLSRTIKGMLTRVGSACDITFDADIDDIDDVFAPAAQINVFRIVQEGVNNIVKHSAASRARVTIARSARSAEISIQDNGKGFGSDDGLARDGAAGFGLMGMRERAKSLGGKVTVRSSPGHGTTMYLVFQAEQRHG